MSLAIDSLLARVSAALRPLPGAVELHLFGSAADAASRDAWSDLDLQVVSQDYALSRAAWPWILNQAGAIRLAYPVQETAYECAFSIALAGESPYHKIDIGLCDLHSDQTFFHSLTRTVLLWRQPAIPPPPAPLFGTAAYVPPPGSAAHFLFGQLLGAVRYLKARRRNQHLACWRFVSASFNALLRCAAWDGAEAHFPQAALSTWDFTALDHSMPEAERLDLLKALQLRTPAQMDQTLLTLTRQLVHHILPPEAPADPRAARLVREYLEFIENELGAGALPPQEQPCKP